MTKRKRRIGGLAWFAVLVAATLLFGSILALISMFFPYAPSHETRTFCRYVLPPILFLLLLGLALLGSLHSRRDPTCKEKFQGNWLKLILASALASVAWAWMMTIVPAIPAKFFAEEKVDIPVTVDSLDGLRIDYDYWTWIHFEQNGVVNKFMWTRSDPVMRSLKRGDCIELHGRNWALGLYVDSISRSHAC